MYLQLCRRQKQCASSNKTFIYIFLFCIRFLQSTHSKFHFKKTIAVDTEPSLHLKTSLISSGFCLCFRFVLVDSFSFSCIGVHIFENAKSERERERGGKNKTPNTYQYFSSSHILHHAPLSVRQKKKARGGLTMYNRRVDWQWGKNFLFNTWITAPENDQETCHIPDSDVTDCKP